MSRTFASVLSFIFHPLLIPFYAVLFIFNSDTWISFSTPQQLKNLILILIIITTYILPGLFTLFLVQRKIISSVQMENKEERKLPFIASFLFYLAAFVLLKQIPIPKIIPLIVFGAALVILASLLITLKWKISIHMMGLGGLAGLMYFLSGILSAPVILPFIFLILLSGIVGTARLVHSSHTQMQIYTGFITGFAIQLLVMEISFN